MQGHDDQVIRAFDELCQYTYGIWQMYRITFDDNVHQEQFRQSPQLRGYLYTLRDVLHEYSLIQISKLHDPAIMRGSKNLSLEFMIDFVTWDDEKKKKLEELKKQMDVLYNAIKPARNKILAHHDYSTIIDSCACTDEERGYLGQFQENLDCEYFEQLSEFLEILRGPCDWCVAERNNAKAFVSFLHKAIDNYRLFK